MSKQQAAPHARAAKASLRHLGQYFLTTLWQLALRGIAFSPLIYLVAGGAFPGLDKEYAPGAALLLCLLLFLLLVLPGRYTLGARLSGWFGAEADHGPYVSRLKKGTMRFLSVAPLVLPILMALYLIYHVFTFLGFPEFFKMLEAPGRLALSLLPSLSGDLSLVIGLAVWALGLIALLWLALWGWRRYMSPSFYLTEGEPRKLGRAHALNALIALPPFIITAALLGASLRPRLMGNMMFDLLTLITAVSQFDFPQSTLSACALVLLLCYLPFVLYRKAAIAAALHSGQ